VEPSCAVTMVVMVLVPAINATGVVAELPLTVTVALASLVAGVTVMLVVALLTDAA